MIRQSNISLKWLGAYVFSFYDSKFFFGLEDFLALFFPSWRGKKMEKRVENSNNSAGLFKLLIERNFVHMEGSGHEEALESCLVLFKQTLAGVSIAQHFLALLCPSERRKSWTEND